NTAAQLRAKAFGQTGMFGGKFVVGGGGLVMTEEYKQKAIDDYSALVEMGIRPAQEKLIEISEQVSNLDMWIPPPPAKTEWEKFSRAIIRLFRDPTAGVFPSIRAGFQEFRAGSASFSQIISGQTPSTLQNMQPTLSEGYRGIVFGGPDEKARKRTISALKGIRQEARNLLEGEFGRSGELSTRETSLIDTLFGMADQQGLPEDTKQKIAGLKAQMLAIETPEQKTKFMESVGHIISQLESEGTFFGQLKRLGNDLGNVLQEGFELGVSNLLAAGTMKIFESLGVMAIDGLKSAVPAMAEVLASMGGEIASFVTTSSSKIGNAIWSMGDFFSLADVPGTIMNWAGSIGSTVASSALSISGTMKNAIWNMADTFSLADVPGIVDAALGYIKEGIVGSGNFVSTVAGRVKGAIWSFNDTFSFSDIGSVISTGLDTIKGWIVGGGGFVSTVAGKAKDAIFGGIDFDNLSGMTSKIKGFLDGLGTGIVDLFKSGTETFTGIKDNLGAAVKNGFMAAGIASMFMPGTELGAGIGSALGTLIGSAFGSAQVCGAIGGLL
ncbi:MAG: hypothetical protein AAB817_01810, partial [Patescibacteria group bacterium]